MFGVMELIMMNVIYVRDVMEFQTVMRFMILVVSVGVEQLV